MTTESVSQQDYRPRPDWPSTETEGKQWVTGGVSLIAAFPILICIAISGLLRRVLWSDFDLGFFFVFGPILAVMGVGVFAPFFALTFLVGLSYIQRGRKKQEEAQRLAERGQQVTGTLTHRWKQMVRRMRYCVAYRFEAELPNGRRRTIAAAEYNSAAYNRLRVGDTIPVLYLPDEPQICRLELPPAQETGT